MTERIRELADQYYENQSAHKNALSKERKDIASHFRGKLLSVKEELSRLGAEFRAIPRPSREGLTEMEFRIRSLAHATISECLVYEGKEIKPSDKALERVFKTMQCI